MRQGSFRLQMIFTNQTFVQTWWRSIIMYVHFWGAICQVTQHNVSSSNTAWPLQTILYWYYISISEIQSITWFYFNFNHTTRNYLHKEYKFIKDVRTPELWTWKLWIEAWLQAVTNHNCPDELPLVIRCMWFSEEASLCFYRICVWNEYFIGAFFRA